MGILSSLEPRRVFEIFEQICAIPHGSGNTKQISDFCVDFAKQRGLRWHQDEINNVVIYKDASAGCEGAPPVILQGHLDMVCKKDDSLDFDFEKDGLNLGIDSDWIHANGTTLGGDDGAAIAIGLAILDTPDLVHPPLEILFTVDEETGMDGAQGIDGSLLKGRRMINLDSEAEGILTVSCAGGCKATCLLPVSRESCGLEQYRITISGLLGGHSGVEIDKGRASSNQLLGRLLAAAFKKLPFFITDIFGGTVDNAIPSLSWAEAAIWQDDLDSLKAVIDEYSGIFRSEYAKADPNITIELEKVDVRKDTALSREDTEKIINALLILPYGIQAMSMDIEGLVQTSLNLGVLQLNENACEMSFSVRSSIESQKRMLIERIEAIIGLLGGSVELFGDYPGWEFRQESPLRDVMIDTWSDLYGKKPAVEAIHAGLECGLFCGKLEGLDAVSCGPDMTDIHSPKERLSISSTERIWKFVCEVLKRLAE